LCCDALVVKREEHAASEQIRQERRTSLKENNNRKLSDFTNGLKNVALIGGNDDSFFLFLSTREK
jgi:hypothetical protein